MSPLPAVPAHAALHTSATASSVKLPRFSPPHTLPVQCFCLRKAFACVVIDVQARARSVRERARVDDTGYEVLRSLTSEVGPRSAGSPGDRRAIAWALAKLTSLGFQNVHAESVTVPHWIRGTARVDDSPMCRDVSG